MFLTPGPAVLLIQSLKLVFKMLYLIPLITLLISGAAYSAVPPPPIPYSSSSVSFESHAPLKISELVRIVLEQFQKRSYVIPPELISDERTVRLGLKNMTSTEARSVLDDVLSGVGYTIIDRGSVSIVVPIASNSESEEKTLLVYEPRYRSVSELIDVVRDIAPGTRSIGERPLKSGSIDPSERKEGTASAQISSSTKDMLVVQVPESKLGRVQSALRQADVARDVFTVRAAVVTLSDSSSRDFSASLNASLDVAGLSLGQALSGASTGLTATLTMDVLKVFLSTAHGSNDARVVSLPSVRVSDGEQARLAAGGRVPIKRAIVQDGVTSEEYEYVDIGARLTVSPEFYRDVTKMNIQYQDDAVAGQSSDAPIFRSLDLTTTVDLPRGHAVLLGGLKSVSTDESRGSSIFGIPLFKSRSSDDSRVWVAVWLESDADASTHIDALTLLDSAPAPSDVVAHSFEECDNIILCNDY